MRLPFVSSRHRDTSRWPPRLSPLSLAVAALALTPSAEAFWPFKKKRFTSEALIDAGSLGLEGVKGRVVALGDVNGDQNTDLFVVREDKHILEVYTWNRAAFKYHLAQTIKFPHDVVNVIPADFNADGRLDFLAVLWDEGGGFWSGSAMKHMEMQVVLGSDKGFGGGEPTWKLGSSGLKQPMVFDDDNSHRVSLLGVEPGPMKHKFRSWRNNGSYLIEWPVPLYPDESNCVLAQPHSSAFIDLDGDCQPDLVLHCRRARANNFALKVFLGRGDPGGYVMSKNIELPTRSKAITFADMNRDGAMDLIFASCGRAYHSSGTATDCRINIAYNKQVGLCGSAGSRFDGAGRLACRGFDDLCRGDPEFDFEFNEDSEYFTSFPITEAFGENAELLFTLPGQREIPLPIRPGDFNVDGFPDLLLTIRDKKTEKTAVKVLENVPCGNAHGCVKGRKNARGFMPGAGKGWQALEGITDALGASWIDLDDDGSLDIMVQRSGKQTGEHITFIQNNFYHDAFFLKAQVLNGACDRGVCEPEGGGKKYSGNGANAIGATFKFTAFDTGGRRHAQQVAQLPQTAHQALGTPHTFIGLGRMNNYVEHLMVGTSISPPNNKLALDQLIPNSQVIINPPWPGEQKDKGRRVVARQTEWRTELFLHPGDWIPWVAAAVVGTVVTLGMVVVWLGEREKKEDEKERRRALHAINFQAL